MKVNLLLDNPGDVRSGYLNIDPFAPANDESRIAGDVTNISHAVDDGEASEVIANDILDYFQVTLADAVLNNWLSKLAHGGTLTVSVVDLKEVAKATLAGNVSIEDVNELLYGRQEKPWQFKKAGYTLSQLSAVLQNRGYKILLRRVQNYRAIVKVERP